MKPRTRNAFSKVFDLKSGKSSSESHETTVHLSERSHVRSLDIDDIHSDCTDTISCSAGVEAQLSTNDQLMKRLFAIFM
jgi:hypothetical protein